MSSRQLRKLQKQREREEKVSAEPDASGAEEEGESTNEDAGATARRPRVNLFAAFGDEADQESDDDHGPVEGEEDEREEQDAQPQDEKALEAVEPTGSQAKTKKNKKKKGKKGKKGKAAAKTLVDKVQSSDDGDEDEIDRALQELGLESEKRDDVAAATTAATSSDSPSGRGINELLGINTQHLKVVHEMRNLFGRDVIESANAEDEQENTRRGRQTVQHVDLETFLKEPSWAKKLPEISLRRNVFIHGREHWPRATAGGLTMTVVGATADGQATEYTYAYDKTYDETQTLFFALVHMGDPMQMVNHLKQSPYHVSMLLQVSSVAKQDQNMALAAELCERALFTFGRMTTSAFRRDIEHGKARLNFNRPENRQFWLAGYHYIKSLIRKGTFRTALEWAKLLFAMDPKDPYAMRHFIHLLAIRAHESSWLLDFLERLGDVSGAGDTVYLQQTRVLALLQMGDAERARSSLAQGMQRVPWLYCALFQELNLDAPPSIWGMSADHDTPAFYVKLYLQQAKDLWNNPQAISLLQDVARSLERVSVAELPVDELPVDRGSVRLAFLDGQTSLMGLAPRDILDSQPNYEFDPLPPPEEENIFSSPATRAPFSDAREHGGAESHHLNLIRADLERLVAAHENLRRGLPRQGQRQGDELDDEALEAALREATETAAGEDEDNSRGLVAGLMRMLGMIGRRGQDDAGEGAEGGEQRQQQQQQGREYLPGAWPEMEAGVYDYDEEDEAYDMAGSSGDSGREE